MTITANQTTFYCPTGFQQPVVVTIADLDDHTASYLVVGGGASEYRLRKEPRVLFEANVTYGTGLARAVVEQMAVKTPADAHLYGRMQSVLNHQRPLTQAQAERLGYYITSKDTRQRFEGLIAFAYPDTEGDWLYEIVSGTTRTTVPRSKFTVSNGPFPGDPPPVKRSALTLEETEVRLSFIAHLMTTTNDPERIKAWETEHAATLDAMSRALAGAKLAITPVIPASPEPGPAPACPAPDVPPYLSTFKGHAMLVLTLDDSGRQFKFGRSKAHSILQNLAAIREFAAGDDAPETSDAADSSPKA